MKYGKITQVRHGGYHGILPGIARVVLQPFGARQFFWP
jgi:hypothetical protein